MNNYHSLLFNKIKYKSQQKNNNIIENTKINIVDNIKTGFININLMGGLCNQIFQVIVGYVLSLKYNKSVVIKSIQQNPHSKINYFDNIFIKINNKLKASDNNYIYREPENECLLYCNIPNVENIELIGYFQNENYFMEYRKEILELLKIEDKQYTYLKEQYTDLSNSYFIHIRR